MFGTSENSSFDNAIEDTVDFVSKIKYNDIYIDPAIYDDEIDDLKYRVLAFDGDEGNVKVPQSVYSRAEAFEVMGVSKCMITEQGNRPIIGLVQNSIVGSALLTDEDVIVPKQIWMDCVASIIRDQVDTTNIDTSKKINILHPTKSSFDITEFIERSKRNGIMPFSGKGLFSTLFPRDFYYSKITKDRDPNAKKDDKDYLLIKEGILIKGRISKETIGTTNNSIIHTLHNRYGSDVAIRFISDTQKLIGVWLEYRGFSTGYSSCLGRSKNAKGETFEQSLSNLAKQIKDEAISMTRKSDDPYEQLKIEHDLTETLNNSLTLAESVVLQHIDKDNQLRAMIDYGSKGAKINLTQGIGFLGQQTVQGKRIHNNFPHFPKDTKDPLARGFCDRSYFKGLTPLQFFMHAMGAREGLTDTAIKTGETGYVQRRLIKALEDLTTDAAGTIRNSNGAIIQFLYGDDGFDAGKIVKVGNNTSFVNVQWLVNQVKSERKAKIYSDERYTNLISPKPRQFSLLSNFQKAIILGTRADQFGIDSRTSITQHNEFDPLSLAYKEYEQQRLPVIIKNFLPDDTYEEVEVNTLL